MYEPDVATMAIGQGVAVTPLQELRAICAIANGGELLQPYIIKKNCGCRRNRYQGRQKDGSSNVITEQVARQMREMMEKVVSEGGGKTAAIKGYRIAGKTGTAEKLAAGGGYAAGQYIASFVALCLLITALCNAGYAGYAAGSLLRLAGQRAYLPRYATADTCCQGHSARSKAKACLLSRR